MSPEHSQDPTTNQQTEKPFTSKFVGVIPLLFHANYHQWSSDIPMHLQAIDAFEIGTENETPPLPMISLAARKSYQLRESKAQGAISGSCIRKKSGWLSCLTKPTKHIKPPMQIYLSSSLPASR